MPPAPPAGGGEEGQAQGPSGGGWQAGVERRGGGAGGCKASMGSALGAALGSALGSVLGGGATVPFFARHRLQALVVPGTDNLSSWPRRRVVAVGLVLTGTDWYCLYCMVLCTESSASSAPPVPAGSVRGRHPVGPRVPAAPGWGGGGGI